MPQVSIIIPVYNVEKYLPECIESIIAQDFSDFECLLVDDGSTDGSGALCDSYAARDSRIKVFHQQNQGVSAARNRGIAEAMGEWISFVDSDDWLDCSYLSDLLSAQIADWIISGYTIHNTDKITELVPPQQLSFEVGKDFIGIIAHLLESYSLYGPYCKLYRKSIIKLKEIKFNETISFGEDLTFNFDYLINVRTISCIPKSNYHYRRSSNTLSTKIYSDKWELDYSQWKHMVDTFTLLGLFSCEVKGLLYNRLYGIVERDIFEIIMHSQLSFTHKLRRIRFILLAKEIEDDEFREAAKCSKSSWWIKESICSRLLFPFVLAMRRL